MEESKAQDEVTRMPRASEEGRAVRSWKVGQTIAQRYKILRIVGRGGIGLVLQVEHLLSGKKMALKILEDPSIRGSSAATLRFQEEIRKISQISHPHAVEIFDCGWLEGELFVVMEYLAGVDLQTLLASEGRLPWPLAFLVGRQACHALQKAHQIGLCHRDLKPSNLMLLHYQGEEPFVKLLDFGLTPSIEAITDPPQTFVFHGDPRYSAPEVVAGKARPSASSDLYSLAAILYEIALDRPFWKDREDGKAFAIVHDEDPPLAPLLEVLSLALSPDPAQRPTSSEAMLHLLEKAASAIQDGDRKGKTATFRLPEPTADELHPREMISRQEWESIERRWRWRTRSRWLLLLVLLSAGAAWLGQRLWRVQEEKRQAEIQAQAIHTREKEPNDSPLQATKIPLDTWIEGTLGDPTPDGRPEADWFRFDLPAPETRIAFRVTPPKLLDIEAGIYKIEKGKTIGQHTQLHPVEILRLNNQRRGEPEVLPSYRLPGGEYFLLLREITVYGEKPQAHLGTYRFILQNLKAAPSDEDEPNDLLAKASPAKFNHSVRGFHDHRRDIDFFSIRLPSKAEVEARWKACTDCPPLRPRWSYYRRVFKDEPIFQLRFFYVPGVEVKIDLLDEKAQPIMTLDREHQESAKSKIAAAKAANDETKVFQRVFTGSGLHYLRIEVERGFDTEKPYRWEITPLPIR